jgi:hypothetical protein
MAPKNGRSQVQPGLPRLVAVSFTGDTPLTQNWKDAWLAMETSSSVIRTTRQYSLSNKQGETLKPGERVEVVGKKSKREAGVCTFIN